MKLTIAIITRDRCNELKRAINSCLGQGNADRIQYVIVDNGSSDETIEYLKRFSDSQPNVKTYYSNENLGVAGGRNKAMEMADGDYVFFLDDDAYIESENLISVVCNFLDENIDVGALTLRTYEEKTDRLLEGALAKNNDNRSNIVETLQFIGCAHVLRRSIFQGTKLYPDKLGYGSEELYASLRIWKKGYSIKYLKNVMIRHIPSSSNRLEERERQYNIITNIYIVKMLVYPFFIRYLTKFVFCIRLIKNDYADKKTRERLKLDFKYRYQSTEIDRISYLRLFQLGLSFGWKNII